MPCNIRCAEFDCIAMTRGCSEEGLQCRRLLSELLLQLTHQQQLNVSASAVTDSRIRGGGENYDYRSSAVKSFGDDSKGTETPGSPLGKVIVVAATNRLQDLDEAVIRRFDTKVKTLVTSAFHYFLPVSDSCPTISSCR